MMPNGKQEVGGGERWANLEVAVEVGELQNLLTFPPFHVLVVLQRDLRQETRTLEMISKLSVTSHSKLPKRSRELQILFLFFLAACRLHTEN